MAFVTGIPPAATQIAFASSTRGLAFSCAAEQACPGKGAVYRTSDGGLTWRKILSSGEPRVLAVDSAPNVVAWLTSGRSTRSARHLHVQIGRAATTIVTVKPQIATVAFRAARDAWGVTDTGRFLTTSDGGRTWASVPANPCASLEATAARLVNATIGLVVCTGRPETGFQAKTVYRTKDGGRHWTRMARATAQDGSTLSGGSVRQLFRSPDGRLWLTVDRAALLVSSDLGRHWASRADLGSGETTPRSLSFPGAKTGFLTRRCGGGRASDVVRSRDRGTTWQELPRAAGPCKL